MKPMINKRTQYSSDKIKHFTPNYDRKKMKNSELSNLLGKLSIFVSL